MKKRTMIVFVAVLILVGLLLASCQSNELSKPDSAAGLNGSFETTDSGYPVNWAFFPNPESGDLFQVTVDTSEAYEGNQSLKLATNQSETTTGFRSRRVPVDAGKKYKISFSMQNAGGNLKVRRIVQDASGKTNKRSDIIVDTSTPTSAWQTFEETVVVSDDEANVVLVFLVDGPGSLWLDDVKVEEISE